jgi:hypothetical protein
MNRIKVDEEIFEHVGKRISGVLIAPRWRGKYYKVSVISILGWNKLRKMN